MSLRPRRRARGADAPVPPGLAQDMLIFLLGRACEWSQREIAAMGEPAAEMDEAQIQRIVALVRELEDEC